MKIERVILFTVLVGVIFFATIALFVYKTFSPGAPQPIDNRSPVTQPVTPTPSTTPIVTPPNADNHTALDDCIALKASNAQGKQYEKGSLLVTFLDPASYDTALDITRVVGVTPDTSAEAKGNFDAHHWLTVTVPTGEEFKWQCLLEGADGVKKANLNFTFNLAQ